MIDSNRQLRVKIWPWQALNISSFAMAPFQFLVMRKC